MRKASWVALLAVATVTPQATRGQGFDGGPERRIPALMEQLREQMWAFRQDLDFFQRAPEYNQLVEQRHNLRNKAIQIIQLAQAGPSSYQAQRDLAKGMEDTARDMYRLARQLEYRTELGARDEVRRRAEVLTEQAVEIRVLIGRWQEAVGMEYRGFRPRLEGAPGGYPQPLQPVVPGGVP